MNAKEARTLIGKTIEWDTPASYDGWYQTRWGVLEDVQGKNAMVNGNWQWLPHMRRIRLKPLPAEAKP